MDHHLCEGQPSTDEVIWRSSIVRGRFWKLGKEEAVNGLEEEQMAGQEEKRFESLVDRDRE